MTLSSTTFGDSPAAMYLVVLLNERANPVLTRKVSKTIANARSVLNDLMFAHTAGALTLRTLNTQLNLISEHNQRDATKAIAAIDPFVAHIVVNVLEAGVKTWKRRGSSAVILQRVAARATPEGFSVPFVIAGEVPGEKDSMIARDRSRAYLARKGKKNTLY